MNTKKLIGTIIGVTLFAALIAGATFAWLTFGTTLQGNTYTGTTMNFIVDYTKGTSVTYLPILDSGLAKPGVSSVTGGVSTVSTELGPNQAAGLVVVMKKNNNSPDGHAIIYLTTTSNTQLTKDGVVRWAICRDPDVETTGEQIDDVCGGKSDFSNALNTGLISNSGTITLINDALYAEDKTCTGIGANTKTNTYFYTSSATLNASTIQKQNTCQTISANVNGTADRDYLIESDGVSYFVYFWMDGQTIKNDHLQQQYDGNNNITKNLYEGYIHASANQLQDN